MVTIDVLDLKVESDTGNRLWAAIGERAA